MYFVDGNEIVVVGVFGIVLPSTVPIVGMPSLVSIVMDVPICVSRIVPIVWPFST